MTGHCPVEKFLEIFFKKHSDIYTQDSYAVAVSGGPDSMTLVHALYVWATNNDKTIHVLTVDHGLRAEAAVEARKVADWVKSQNSQNILHATLVWEGKKPDVSILEEARHARYKLTADYCLKHNIQTLFVAHHQDDQAETFLIRLAKGSGLDGLAAMNELQKYNDDLKIARPFLSIIKQDLISYCRDKDIYFISDPSNENIDYLRPRLRKSMAVLEEEGLSVKRLSALARRLRRARSALEGISEKSYQYCLKDKTDTAIILDFQKFCKETEEIAFRILQKAISDMRGREDYGVRMDKVESLFESLWYDSKNFKPRTLGGLVFALRDKNSALYIKREYQEKG